MAADSLAGVGTADDLALPPRAVGRSRRGVGDRVYRGLILASVWLVLALAGGLLLALGWESWAAIRAFDQYLALRSGIVRLLDPRARGGFAVTVLGKGIPAAGRQVFR